MKITFFSDTHRKHGLGCLGDYSAFADTDVAVFSGDMSMRGTVDEVKDFLQWYDQMPVKHKIFIAGNHDYFWEKSDPIAQLEMLNGLNLIYLNDSGCTIDGVMFWGSPIQPWFHSWAFNRMPGEDIKKHWDLIPAGTDVLITHGPPKNILDRVIRDGQTVGCPTLRDQIFFRIKPKVHAFGHIHEGYGTHVESDVIFVNSSHMNEHYEPVNKAISVVVETKRTFKLID